MHPMLNIAVKAARRAGSIINRASLDIDAVRVSKKQHNDFVTEVDQAAEQAIIQTLQQAYPDHAILAEESGESDHESEFQWIIDPLDGTTNFIHGMPYYCVSVALAHRGQVTQSVIYDPTRNDLFTASRGRGAYLNERRIRVSRRDRLADGLIGTGFPYRDLQGIENYLKMFSTMTEHCAGIRRPGAAALDLAYVAAGRMDGFFEQGLKPWDMAAGSLLVSEAGGLVGNYTGESDFLHQGEILAGNPKMFAQMVKLLEGYSRVKAPTPAAAPKLETLSIKGGE
ncbi:inositol monophosphatase [Pandoraea terrae]|uniref:Inositol-1-monophosphatase n=1 Tax=Pandoraea terrae TaxID=1537710 RepID=A0A5E4VZT4_9BURK|nr:inositol monophosphatase family protein [Pandoraea terrae]VVE16395.1 inositol monophosphatase [Pandoraea terrae]